MRFGASSWPFQWDPPYEEAIRRVAGVGFKAIELIAWNVDFLENYWTKSKIGDMKAELKNSGISLSQFVHTPHDLSHADKGKRAAAVEQWEKAVAVGAELGSPIINMVSSHPFAMRDTVEIPRITTKPLVQKYATRDVPRGVDWDQNFKEFHVDEAPSRAGRSRRGRAFLSSASESE
jgi:sugar phosphate isomerase/epimerase